MTVILCGSRRDGNRRSNFGLGRLFFLKICTGLIQFGSQLSNLLFQLVGLSFSIFHFLQNFVEKTLNLVVVIAVFDDLKYFVDDCIKRNSHWRSSFQRLDVILFVSKKSNSDTLLACQSLNFLKFDSAFTAYRKHRAFFNSRINPITGKMIEFDQPRTDHIAGLVS